MESFNQFFASSASSDYLLVWCSAKRVASFPNLKGSSSVLFFLSVGSAGSNIVKLHFDAEIRSSHRVWRPRSSVLFLQGLNFIVIWLWFLVHLRNCIFFAVVIAPAMFVFWLLLHDYFIYTPLLCFALGLVAWLEWVDFGAGQWICNSTSVDVGLSRNCNVTTGWRQLIVVWRSWIRGKKSNCWKQSTSISERWLLHASKVTFRCNWIAEWLVGVRKECFFSFLVIFFEIHNKAKILDFFRLFKKLNLAVGRYRAICL